MSMSVMSEFPPPDEDQVRLSNWRLPPYSRWAFSHVREVVPSADIPAEAPAAAFDEDEAAAESIKALKVKGKSGGDVSLQTWFRDSQTDSVTILKDGKLAMSWQATGIDARRPHIIFSISKSVTACLVGILAGEGVIDVSLPVSTYIPEAVGSAYGDASVQQVLDMLVAVDFDESYLEPTGDYARYREATAWNPPRDPYNLPDLRSFLVTLKKRTDRDHGEVFSYTSPTSDLLGWVIERAAGRRYADLLSERLWTPLGARRAAYITVDRLGAPRTAGGICMTSDDLARLGQLMLDGGKSMAGQQVVPEAFIEDTLTKGNKKAWARGEFVSLFATGNYRNKWYNVGDGSGAFTGIGIHGQWLWCHPGSRTVIAKLSSQNLPLDEPLDLHNVEVFKAIQQALS